MKNKWNSRRFLGVAFFSVLFALTLIKGIFVGFSSDMAWTFLTVSLTPITMAMWCYYLKLSSDEKKEWLKINGK